MGCNVLVSIIIPCYNYAKFLPETLDSVLIQSFNDWECIVVDDGSTDDTQQYIELQQKVISCDLKIFGGILKTPLH